MQVTTVAELVPLLQTAIGPVILISGVGLFILTMTNRLGRIIDRVRLLSAELPQAGPARAAKIVPQIHIFCRRARVIRLAITLVLMSALSAAILVILLFFTAWLQLETAWLIGALFVICMGCLIAGLVVFIQDINRSLVALKLELAADGIEDLPEEATEEIEPPS